MGDPPSLGPGLHLPIYCGGADWYRLGQLLPRYYASRHILRSRPLPLRPVYGSRLCYYSRVRALIPPTLRLHPAQHMVKNSLRGNVCWGKLNLLPPALPRPGRYAPTVLGLPGRLHPVEYGVFPGLSNLPDRRNYVPIYHLGGFRC